MTAATVVLMVPSIFSKAAITKINGELVSDELKKTVQRQEAEQAMSLAYTKEALEDIAASQGMGGLKSIADPLGVKGRSKQELITEILEAQAKS